ncbi:hypothetical protein [Paenibacillus sp. SI8]|uniref:hypothetical protein n=1 Tax=unclassified Paenibacillus TaxID=185978 RepID=UPI00346694D0
MALIPLKQSVIITKAGSSDGWGGVVDGGPVTLKARVVEETKVITASNGQEAVTSLRVTLDKLANVSYDDTITYTNENGVTVTRKPLGIEVKRGIGGKPLLTEVFV